MTAKSYRCEIFMRSSILILFPCFCAFSVKKALWRKTVPKILNFLVTFSSRQNKSYEIHWITNQIFFKAETCVQPPWYPQDQPDKKINTWPLRTLKTALIWCWLWKQFLGKDMIKTTGFQRNRSKEVWKNTLVLAAICPVLSTEIYLHQTTNKS